MLWGRVKICENCMYDFLKILKSQVKLRQVTLKHTTLEDIRKLPTSRVTFSSCGRHNAEKHI